MCYDTRCFRSSRAYSGVLVWKIWVLVGIGCTQRDSDGAGACYCAPGMGS